MIFLLQQLLARGGIENAHEKYVYFSIKAGRLERLACFVSQ